MAPAPPLAIIVELQGLRLERSSAELVGIKAGQRPTHLEMEIQGGGAKVPDVPDLLRLAVRIEVTAKASREPDAPPIAQFKTAFGVDYRVPSAERLQSVTEAEIQELARTVGVHNVWPYAREFVQSSS